jgi:peptide/nickel transport system permease protein
MGPGHSRTLRVDAWRRLRKNRLALVALAWILLITTVAVSADLWVPWSLGDPTGVESTTVAQQALRSPSMNHPSRVIYGARVSLLVGIAAVAIMVLIGLVAGGVAAYYGGWWDAIIMRTADVFFAFPYVLFAIVLLALLGNGVQNVFIAIGVLGWPSIARLFRSCVVSVKELEYVDAARVLGASGRRILARHIMPNAVAPIIVYATMSVGGAVLTEAALSFLGMGVKLPSPSWGNMLDEARDYMFSAPWLMLYPGIAILTTVLAFVLLGDGLRDAFDVKIKER